MVNDYLIRRTTIGQKAAYSLCRLKLLFSRRVSLCAEIQVLTASRRNGKRVAEHSVTPQKNPDDNGNNAGQCCADHPFQRRHGALNPANSADQSLLNFNNLMAGFLFNAGNIIFRAEIFC